MRPGWKNDPLWRMYHAQVLADRRSRRMALITSRIQQAAIDEEAQHILNRVARDNITTPRH